MPIVRDDLLPLFKDTLIPTAQKLVEKIGELFTWFNNLSPEVKNASFQFMGLVAVIGPAALALSSLVGGVSSAKIAIGGMKTVFTTLIPIITKKTVAVKASAVAWKALNLAIVATPVGIIVTLTALFAGFTVTAYKKEKADKAAYEAAIKHSQAITKSATETLKLTTQTNNLLSSYSELAIKTKLTKEEQEEQRQIVEKLKELYPDLDIAYDNNGRVIGSLTDMVYGLNEARKQEELQAIASQKATVDAEITKRKSELESMEARLKDKNSAENTGITGGITLNHNKELVEKELANLELELEKLKEVEDKLKNTAGGTNSKTKDPQTEALQNKIALLEEQLKLQNQNNNASGGGQDKGFADYLLDLEKELLINDRKVEQLKEINKNYDDTQALQQRNAIITSAITEMASELQLTEEQALQLGDTYGKAFNSNEAIADFGTMKNAIYENIEAYEKEIEARRVLGEKIEDSEVNQNKSDIAKKGILDIASVLGLTTEEVITLKEEFADLFESVETDSQTLGKYLEQNWEKVLEDTLSFTNNLLGNVNTLIKNSTQAQIDELERRKQNSIDAINTELSEYLKANKLMEKTEKDRLKDSIKEMQKRQKVALGLYEQERLKKAIEEEQTNLKRIIAEEVAQLKIAELEKKYANEKMRLEHKQAMASWAIQLAQATASVAQSIINAVASGSKFGIPGIIANVAVATALTGTQLAAIAVAKPLEPQYLASGGLIRRRAGGINAIIGEGNSNEAVIPLKDDVLASIGEAMALATQNKQIITSDNSNTQNIGNDFFVSQPVLIQIDGRTLYASILQASKRGIKVVHNRGIIR